MEGFNSYTKIGPQLNQTNSREQTSSVGSNPMPSSSIGSSTTETECSDDEFRKLVPITEYSEELILSDLTDAHENAVPIDSGTAPTCAVSPPSPPSCLVCYDLRYIRVINQAGKPRYFFIDPNLIKESRKLPKLEFAQFMAIHFRDPSILTEGRPVNFDYGAVAIKVKAGHRPRHPAYFNYVKRASEGCKSCSLIVDVVESAIPKNHAADLHVLAWAVQGYPLQLLITKCSETVVSSRELYLEVFTTPGEPKCWPTVGTAELVCRQNYGQEVIEKVRKWVHECKTEHDCLDVNITKTFIPHMVIDLSGERPRLAIRPTYSSYVALSYCWGKGVHERNKTTSLNLKRHMVSIDVSSLPATIREAMNFVARLGYRYIWIDSLCILQDDTTAWLRESKEMALIYGHADLVIVADIALDCTSSLYLNSQEFSSPSHQRTINLKNGWNGCQRVSLRKPYWKTHDPSTFLNSVPGPTATRAWTWQEFFSSQRRLILSPFELRFACEQYTNCECAGLWQEDSAKGNDPWVPLVRYAKANYRGHSTDFGGHPTVDFYSLWLSWVSDYSRRNVTNASDRLVAFSAVAQVMQSAISKAIGHQEVYAAGHWVGDIPRSLLWTAMERPSRKEPVLSSEWVQKVNKGAVPFGERKQEPSFLSKYLPADTMFKVYGWFPSMFPEYQRDEKDSHLDLSKYIAPSWSWASMNQPVWYLPLLGHTTPIAQHKSPPYFGSKLEIEEVITSSTLPNDPTGLVSAGHLIVTGRLCEVQLRCTPAAPESFYTNWSLNAWQAFAVAGYSPNKQQVLHFCRNADGYVYRMFPDHRQAAVPTTALRDFECWYWFVCRNGIPCRDVTCGCQRGWSKREYYCLEVGVARMEYGPARQLANCWLLLKKSEVVEGAYERVGVGVFSYFCHDPSQFHLFEGASRVTVKIV